MSYAINRLLKGIAMKKVYQLSLPVFKQGSDFDWHFEHTEDVQAAFELLAEQYQDAARMCQQMAEAAKDVNFDVLYADSHAIILGTSEGHKAIDTLINDEILHEANIEDDESDLDLPKEGKIIEFSKYKLN